MREIRMAHPAKNALGRDLLSWLEGELDASAGEPILLTGTGDVFSAGLHLGELAALEAADMEPFLRRVDGLARRLYEYPAPTVALVNGHAIAGGCILVQCCDWRVAEDESRARIGLTEVALGACFPPAMLRMLAHRLPRQHVERLLLGAELFSPVEALALGLLDEVSRDAGSLARERLERLARHPRDSYARTKTALRAGVCTLTAEDERRFTEQELPLWTSEALRQRVRAALRR